MNCGAGNPLIAASLLLLIAGCSGEGAGSGGHTWDLAADFSTVSNPAGPWSYGEQVSGAWVIAAKPLGYNMGPAWDGVVSVNKHEGFVDGVASNAADLDSDNATPDARWTAPRAGSYSINVQIGGSDTLIGGTGGVGNLDVANGQLLVNGVAATATSFTNNVMTFTMTGVSLAAGGTLDVVVNQKLGGGNTQVVFQVSQQ